MTFASTIFLFKSALVPYVQNFVPRTFSSNPGSDDMKKLMAASVAVVSNSGSVFVFLLTRFFSAFNFRLHHRKNRTDYTQRPDFCQKTSCKLIYFFCELEIQESHHRDQISAGLSLATDVPMLSK